MLSSTDLHVSKYSAISLFHITLSLTSLTRSLRRIASFWVVSLLLVDVESVDLIAFAKLLWHEFCGAPAFLGACLH